jgi:hypothetical protein
MDVTRPDSIDEFFDHQATHRLAEQDGQAEAGHDEDPLETFSDHNDYQKNNQRYLPQIKMRKKGDHPVEEGMDPLQVKETQQGRIYLDKPVHC